jgi:hypothetical protein
MRKAITTTEVKAPFALFAKMWFSNFFVDRKARIILNNLINLNNLPALRKSTIGMQDNKSI